MNFKPVSLHEILSDRDKQGIISEWQRRATSLTRPIFDEKRIKQERGAWQSMTGLRTWLCYVEIILASTVIGIFLPIFFSPWSCINICNSTHKTQTIKPVCTLMFSTMFYTTVWSISYNYKCSNISVGSESSRIDTSVYSTHENPHMRTSKCHHMRTPITYWRNKIHRWWWTKRRHHVVRSAWIGQWVMKHLSGTRPVALETKESEFGGWRANKTANWRRYKIKKSWPK